jgi:hypothetical protein
VAIRRIAGGAAVEADLHGARCYLRHATASYRSPGVLDAEGMAQRFDIEARQPSIAAVAGTRRMSPGGKTQPSRAATPRLAATSMPTWRPRRSTRVPICRRALRKAIAAKQRRHRMQHGFSCTQSYSCNSA